MNPPMPNTSPEKTNKKSLSQGIIIILIIFSVGASYMAMYYRQQAVNAGQSTQVDSETLQREVAALLADVGQLIVLPENEKPVIATVTEPEKLSGQPFFANAKIGDKVFIYTEARKAILYSPSLHKIIEVAPLTIGEPVSDETPAEEAVQEIQE